MSGDERLNFDDIARRISPADLARVLDTHSPPGEPKYHCPAPDHPDENPSFSISRDDGRTVGRCWSCNLRGSPVQLVAKVQGLDPADAAQRLAEVLGDDPHSENGSESSEADDAGRSREEMERNLRLVIPGRRNESPDDEAESDDEPESDTTAHVYHDAAGNTVARKLRGPDKSFRWERWTADGWRPGLGGLDVPLYRLSGVDMAVEGGETVWIVEGEKDADNGREATGETFTSPPDGAGSWTADHTDQMSGAETVYVVADNDLQGWSHAAEVARELAEQVASVETFLPAVDESHADLTDHLQAGYGLDQLRAVSVDELERRVRLHAVLNSASDERLRDLEARLFSAREVLEEGVPPEPPNVVPKLAWRRRLTLFTAPKGGGKTTFFSAAAARFTRGESFLGAETGGPGTVLWISEEARGDPVGRHRDWGGDPDRFFILEGVGRRPLEDLELAAALREPDWIIVDTLSTLSEPLGLEVNDSAGWTRVMRQIRELVQVHDATATIAHHPTKKDTGQPRDSAAIEEQADVSLVYKRSGGSNRASIEVVKARRLDHEELTCELRLTEDGFALIGEEDGGPSIKTRIRSFVDREGPVTKREVREGVTGSSDEIDAALRELLDEKQIYDDDSVGGRGAAYRVSYGSLGEGE